MDCVSCKTPLTPDARFCSTCGLDVTDPRPATEIRRRNPTLELQQRLARTLSGRYEIKRLLGQGGMAAVFLADELGLDRPVAIKVLPPELSRDEGIVHRFEREARTAAKLDHPNIIPIHRVESEAGLHYFVMKYVPGRSLEDVLAADAPLPLDIAVRILREAALALGHAHERGVVHRDVKPANIMLDQDDRVVLTDFGISRAGASTSLTQTGMIIGTPHYMAPEQAIGAAVDGRADQYSLGVVAYQVLTRKCPFEGESAHTVLYKHIHEAPPPVALLRPELPPHLADAVATALAKDPNDRFPTMEDFARALGGESSAFDSVRERAAKQTLLVMPTPSRVATVLLDPTNAAKPRAARATRTRLVAGVAGIAAVALAAVVWTTSSSAGADPATPTGSSAGAPATLAGGDPSPADPTGKSPGISESTGDIRADADGGETTRPPVSRANGSVSMPEDRQPEPPRTAPFTISTEPYGELYIDDVFIGDTPVANHPLEVGRTYRIRVEREGYRPFRETIEVKDGNAIRRRPPPLVPTGDRS